MKRKSPAFQYYPKDFLADPNVAVMSTLEVGAYWLLISYCWIDGSLPTDHEQLARLCRLDSEAFSQAWATLKPCFQESGGRYIQPRLKRERAKQLAYHRRMSAAGKKGVKVREKRRLAAQAEHKPSISKAQALQSSISNLQPTVKKTPSTPPNGGAMSRQVEACWESHLRARQLHNNGNGANPPALTQPRRRLIRRAIEVHGYDKAKAAGIGIFLDDFHCGQNDRKTSYLTPEHAWRMNASTDNVERFAELVARERRGDGAG